MLGLGPITGQPIQGEPWWTLHDFYGGRKIYITWYTPPEAEVEYDEEAE